MKECEQLIPKGLQWLENNRNDDGHWGIAIGFRSDIPSTLFAIWAIIVASEDLRRGKKVLSWILSQQNPDGGWPSALGNETVIFNAFYIGVVLKSYYARSGDSQLVRDSQNRIERAFEYIVQNQHPNGGWSAIRADMSNVHDTCHALGALHMFASLAGISLGEVQRTVQAGILYLLDQRDTVSRGWGLTTNWRPDVHQTAHVLEILRLYEPSIEEKIVCEGFDFLLQHQQKNGGWTIADGSVDNTAQVFMTLLKYHLKPPTKRIQKAIRWLLHQQKPDGGWCSSLKTQSGCALLTGANVAQIILARERLKHTVGKRSPR